MRERAESRAVREESLVAKTKLFGDSLKHALPRMPIDHAELPFYLESVTRLFHMYEVPLDIQARLLIPLLTPQAKTLVGRLPEEKLKSFADICIFLLAEFKITPRELRNRFVSATKKSEETFTLYTSRLKNLLEYYIRSKKVTDFESLLDLVVADKLKDSLYPGAYAYVVGIEREQTFGSAELATLVDTYVNTRLDTSRYGQVPQARNSNGQSRIREEQGRIREEPNFQRQEREGEKF